MQIFKFNTLVYPVIVAVINNIPFAKQNYLVEQTMSGPYFSVKIFYDIMFVVIPSDITTNQMGKNTGFSSHGEIWT